MPWITITNHNAVIVSQVRPDQVIYAQQYKVDKEPPDGSGARMAYGEIIVAGGAFIFWNESEANAAWRMLKLPTSKRVPVAVDYDGG